MKSLNLYINNVANIQNPRITNSNFPINEATSLVIYANERDPLYINNTFVYQGTGAGNQDYVVYIGKKGLYKFNDKFNLFNSGNSVSLISYQQNTMSDKRLQIDVGNITNGTLNLNLTGAIKFHLIHDTNGALIINNISITSGGLPGTSVIDIGNDIDIINDNITIGSSSTTGYIIERLI